MRSVHLLALSALVLTGTTLWVRMTAQSVFSTIIHGKDRVIPMFWKR
jgi:hypothetical protein